MRILVFVIILMIGIIVSAGCFGNSPKKPQHAFGDCSGKSYEISNQSCCLGKIYVGSWGECGGTCFDGEIQKCCNKKIVPTSEVCCADQIQPNGSFIRNNRVNKSCISSGSSIIQFCIKTTTDPDTGCEEITAEHEYEVLGPK